MTQSVYQWQITGVRVIMRTWRCPRCPNRTVRHHLMTPIPERPQWVCLPVTITESHLKSQTCYTNHLLVFRRVPTWNPNVAISPPPTHSSPVPLMKSSTLSRRTAAAATTASHLGRRRAPTETHGRTRWRAMWGCTTFRHFPWRRLCYLRTETNLPWSTEGSPPCRRSAACCKNSTGPCLCPSGRALIRRQEGNPAASRYRGTAGSTPSWPPPPLQQIRESPSSITWTGPEILVRHKESSNITQAQTFQEHSILHHSRT